MQQKLRNDLQAISDLPIYHRLGLIVLCLLAFSLPFELERPILVVGIIQLTNVELLLLMSILLALFATIKERRWQQPGWSHMPTSWLFLFGLFALFTIASAVLAPEFKTNALKAAFRTLSGLALAVALPQLIQDKRHLRWLLGALMAGGLLSIGLGLIEILSGQTLQWLKLFRPQPTVAGPYSRLTGSFNHANQTAMFLEATLPFLLAVVWLLGRKGYRILSFIGGGVVLIYLQASFFTLSRSSYVTIFMSILIVAIMIWVWLPRRRRLGYYWGAAAGLALLLIGLNTWLNPIVRLRLSSEGDNEWYRVSYIVPEKIEIEAGEILPVPVTVTNEGSLYWSSNAEKPFNLGGRWYRVADNTQSKSELRWTLEKDVAPGESLEMTALLVAPIEAGQYEFEWDMVQEDVIWFSFKNGLRITSQVTVLPSSDSAIVEEEPGTFTTAPPTAQPIPNRSVLWSIAARQFLERPLLGLGLDNFRLTYGKVMGWQAWNDSIHTNNWYIEMIVSVGILGSLPFFGWLGLFGLDILKRMRSGRINLWQIALISSLLTYLIHGVLDYFLMFNGTGLLFWTLVGIWMVLAWSEPSA